MSSMKKRSSKMQVLVGMVAVLALAWSTPVMAGMRAEQGWIRREWVDFHKGPEEAQWVDGENQAVQGDPNVQLPQWNPEASVAEGDPNAQLPQWNPEASVAEGDPNAQLPQWNPEASAAEGDPNAQLPQWNPETSAAEEDPNAHLLQWNPEISAAEEDPNIQPSQQNPEGSAAEENPNVQPPQEDPAASAAQETAAVQTAGNRVIDPARPMVALTFDDGPYAPVGNQIMDCLAQYGGKATFYVVGNRCAGYAAEMQRMAAEGHEIGNHTYEHKYLNTLSAEQIQYQVNKGSEAIQAACGVIPATVRLPGGNKNATVLANVNQPIIMWSIDTLDWKTRNTQSTVEKVLGSVRDGDIVLMHELYSQTGNAAVQIIPALIGQGYQLVTVSELAQYRGGLQNGQIYSAFRP